MGLGKSRRFPRTVPVLIALLLCSVAFGLVLRTRVESTAARATLPVLRGTQVFRAGMEPALPFKLHDQRGHLVTLQSLRGTIFALTFLDSHCIRECPVAGREIAAVQRQLGPRSPLTLVVVSVNPVDTAASAMRFIREAGIRGSWRWLLGTRPELVPIWTEYGILVKPVPGDIVHTAALYLVDRHGSVRVADAIPLQTDKLVDSVRALAAGV